MSSTGCFVLPLESEPEDEEDKEEEKEESDLLSIESGDDKKKIGEVKQAQVQAQSELKKKKNFALKRRSKLGILKFTWRMIKWHIFIFLAIFASLYATFYYCFDDKHKKFFLQAISLFDDWRQMVFFLGIFFSFAVKKVSDVNSHIPVTDKIANLVSIAVKNNRTQKAILKYVCTSLAMVFSYLSPMVQRRLYCSNRDTKAKLEVQGAKIIEGIERKLLNMSSSHFMPIKWALSVIHEAQEKKEIEERFFNTIINEINLLHTQCDRLINFKHETFSGFLTTGATLSVYSYFLVGSLRQLWTGLVEEQSHYILSTSLFVNFIVFMLFLVVLRSAEQIVQPYNYAHDVFELNRILNERLKVASFVLDKDCDLRKLIRNQHLYP